MVLALLYFKPTGLGKVPAVEEWEGKEKRRARRISTLAGEE
jgi:hypothetical protein